MYRGRSILIFLYGGYRMLYGMKMTAPLISLMKMIMSSLGSCAQAYGLGQGIHVEPDTTPHKPIKKHDIK